MGMLGTVINSLALSNAITRGGVKAKVFSALTMPSVADSFTARAAKSALDDGFVVVCAGGTGNPFFTTDTAAALKAIELECDVLLKGTKVDGVYDADPKKNPNAKRYETVTYDEAIARNLKVRLSNTINSPGKNRIELRRFYVVHTLPMLRGGNGFLAIEFPERNRRDAFQKIIQISSLCK